MPLESRPLVLKYIGFGGDVSPYVNLESDLPDLPDGNSVYVRSRRSWYQRTGGAWIRDTNQTDPAWAQTADIYVNYNTGNDDGEGTVSDPLATVTEAFKRLGRNEVNADPYLYIHQTGDATESKWDLSASSTTSQPVTIQGEPTVLLSTTVTVGAWNAATNTYGTLTGASSLASHAAPSATTNGRCFRVVSASDPSRVGAHGVLGLHLGSGVVQYELAAQMWTPGGIELVTGDTIEILDLPAMPPALLQRRGTVVFYAYLSGLSGLHAAAIEAGEAWFTACEIAGDVDGETAARLSFVACSMAGHDARCEEAGAYLEVCSGRHHGIAARPGSIVELEDVTLTDRSVIEEGSIVRHRVGHIWLARTASGPTVEVYSSGSLTSKATAGVICGTGLVGSTGAEAGMIWMHTGSRFVGSPPVCSGSGTQFNVAGTAKLFSDAASYYSTAGASIGPRS